MPRKPNKDLYEVLGVTPLATDEEITRARRRKASKAHPDKGGEHAEMAEINEAFDILNDPKRRLLYDQTGEDYGSGKDMDDEVRHVLLQVFTAALEIETPDPLMLVRELVDARRVDIKTANGKVRAEIETLQTRRGQIVVKEGENVFQMLIDGRIRSHEALIALNDHLITVLDAALERLKDYKMSGFTLLTMEFSRYMRGELDEEKP